jgi:hypothetical protein
MAINIADIISRSETIEVEETTDGVTAYYVYQTAKKVFDQLGLPFVNGKGNEITSQSFYNDSRNGKINGVKGGGDRRYTEDEVTYYIATLIKKAGYKA